MKASMRWVTRAVTFLGLVGAVTEAHAVLLPPGSMIFVSPDLPSFTAI